MSLSIRLAQPTDAAAVTACVCEAFIHYIPKIGKQPGPMLDDYQALIMQKHVHIACRDTAIVGVVVLLETDEGFCIETIAVHPNVQGTGVGRKLLDYAEEAAKAAGYPSIYLSTNRVMYASQAVYAHVGYVEFDQRVVNGYDRIFVRKQLS